MPADFSGEGREATHPVAVTMVPILTKMETGPCDHAGLPHHHRHWLFAALATRLPQPRSPTCVLLGSQWICPQQHRGAWEPGLSPLPVTRVPWPVIGLE